MFSPGTGGECPQGSVRCGKSSAQCIMHYLLCDGSTECRNGFDEDPSFCGKSVLFISCNALCGCRPLTQCQLLCLHIKRLITYVLMMFMYPIVSLSRLVRPQAISNKHSRKISSSELAKTRLAVNYHSWNNITSFLIRRPCKVKLRSCHGLPVSW